MLLIFHSKNLPWIARCERNLSLLYTMYWHKKICRSIITITITISLWRQKGEKDYVPWLAAVNGMGFVRDILSQTDSYGKYMQYMIKIGQAQYTVSERYSFILYSSSILDDSGSQCRWIGAVIGVILVFLIWEGVLGHCGSDSIFPLKFYASLSRTVIDSHPWKMQRNHSLLN